MGHLRSPVYGHQQELYGPASSGHENTLQHDLGWNEIDYSNLVFAFQPAYAVGLLVVGRFIDRAGTRIGYGLAMAGSYFVPFLMAGTAYLMALGVLQLIVPRLEPLEFV